MRYCRRVRLGLICAVLCATTFIYGHSAVTAATAVAAEPSGVIGWIEVRPSSKGVDHIMITAHAHAIAPANGKFRLVVTRWKNRNRSKSQQSGSFDLEPGEGRALSKTTINLRPSDQLKLELILSVDGQDVFSSRLQPSRS